MIKNSLKVFKNKIGLLLPLMMYFFVVGVILAAISLPFWNYINTQLHSYGFYDSAIVLAQSQDIGSVIKNSESLLSQIIGLIDNGDSIFFGNVFLFVLLLLVIFRVLFAFYQIPLSESIHNKLSANADIGFVPAFVSKLGLCFRYTFISLVYKLFCDVLTIGLFVLLFNWSSSYAMRDYLPVLFVVLVVLLMSLRKTLNSCWLGYMLIDGNTPSSAFYKSIKKGCTHFVGLFLLNIIIVTLVLALNFAIALVTNGFGLLLTVPITILFFSVYELLVYYHLNHKNIWVSGKVLENSECRMQNAE